MRSDIEDAQFARVSEERDVRAVRGPLGIHVALLATRELRLLALRQVVAIDVPCAVAVRRVREPPTVRRPRHLGFRGRRACDPNRVAPAVAPRDEYLPMR